MKLKNRLTLLLSIVCVLFVCSMTRAQSTARTQINSDFATRDANAKIIAALACLDQDVIVYRSLGEFEASGKLARVSLPEFERELSEVTREVQAMIARMPASKLKIKLTNALDSFQDGAYWWRQVDLPQVVSVSALASTEVIRSSADAAFISNAPYTVAINWRQAHKYLIQAEELAK